VGAQQVREHRDDGDLDDLEAVGSAHGRSKAQEGTPRERERGAGAVGSGRIQLPHEPADFADEATDAVRRHGAAGAGRRGDGAGGSGAGGAFGHRGGMGFQTQDAAARNRPPGPSPVIWG
jgi:hypothetical protein